MSETASPVRRGRTMRIAAALAVLLALVGYVVVQYVTGGGAPRCTVRAADGEGPTYELSAEQAANAATISAVGTTRGLPERAVTIALATALQESALRNIKHGDRDSLGLFQQRPSKGWGTPKQILDPVYASERFYERLAEVPGYSRLPLTVAAQRVQRSGFPQAYAKHEPNAGLLAAALTGRASAALTCESRRGDAEAGDAGKVRSELVRAFGPEVLPKGASAGRTGAPAARELSVPVEGRLRSGLRTDGGGAGQQRGWELAHWAVARAEELHIEEVSFGGRVWSSKESERGWRQAEEPAAAEGETARSGAGEVRMRIAR
ncbi:hypothetical protein AB0M39_19180 [Streptomyces sp. NPDC051907]|uniref:hypothetical protein n=1 Tax=Streptomyces sp. NPDC051907 TaxID=3155284 RepID=UPI00342068C0